MANATQIIERAYTLIGVKALGEPMTAEESQYALDSLNALVDSWNTQSYYSPVVTEIVATVSGLPITIGSGMMINVDRPVRTLAGSFIRWQGSDFQIVWITGEQYNEISVKNVSGQIPAFGFYDAQFPTGEIYLWPYPQAGAELHLQIPYSLSQFADLSTDYPIVPGYLKALQYSLAEELAVGIKGIDPAITRTAAIARKAIRRTNVDVPMMSVGDSLSSPYAQFISGL